VLGDAAIAVHFSSLAAHAAFAWRFADQTTDQPTTRDFFVVDDLDRTVFWGRPEHARVWSHGKLNPAEMVFFADLTLCYDFFSSTPWLSLHAATLSLDTRAIALIGATTTGKTTTAIAAVRSGLRFLSDERCIMRDGRVYPFLRSLTIRPGGRKLLLSNVDEADAPDGVLRDVPGMLEAVVQPHVLFGDRIERATRGLQALVILDGYAETPLLEPVPLAAVLPLMLKALQSSERGIGRIARLFAECKSTPCFRLRLGSPAATAVRLHDVFNAA
jgi:hypothetical protein